MLYVSNQNFYNQKVQKPTAEDIQMMKKMSSGVVSKEAIPPLDASVHGRSSSPSVAGGILAKSARAKSPAGE